MLKHRKKKIITIKAQQEYLIHINNAMLYSVDSLYQKACDEYEIAFSFRKDYVIDLFECTKLFDKLNSTEKTLKYLKMSIEAGCDWYNDSKYLPHLISTHQLPPSSELQKYRKLYFQDLNIDYLLQLEKLVARDQTIRKRDIAHVIDEDKLMAIIDPANMDSLKSLVKKYGYPEYGTVGYSGVTDAFILLLHGLFDGTHDSLDWEYFQPIILSEVKNGHLMPDYYAFLYDRVISDHGRGKQCYGMQWNANTDGTYVFTTIYDVENVDIRRREIGLMPLGDWAKKAGMKEPQGYIRK